MVDFIFICVNIGTGKLKFFLINKYPSVKLLGGFTISLSVFIADGSSD